MAFILMGKQGKTKSPGSQKSVSSPATKGMAKDPPGTSVRSFAGGWKWPLVFAFGVAGVASFSIWHKATGDRPVGTDEGGAASANFVAAARAAAPDFPKNTGPEAGFHGAGSCAECHASIAESYGHIAMGRSLHPPAADNIIEDYEDNNEFFHEKSGIYYRMTHEGDKFFQTSFQKGPEGSTINEKKVEVTYVLGSGNNSRSYIHRNVDGQIYQLPVAWYTDAGKWGMSPGYDSENQINFSRRVTYDCLFCHAAYPDVPAGADQGNFAESAFFPEHLEAIDCERCHGPAQEHVTLARGGAAVDAVRDSIVNPANLSHQLQMEVCMQCHLETTSGKLPHSVHTVDKGVFGYRPGEPLVDYRYAFDHPPGTGHDDKFEIAGQAYRLMMSPCYTESEGRMTCTTCHDPHRIPKDKITAAIQSCMECHKPADCGERVELRIPVQDNCIQCHMPQRRTDDVVNVVMTDHFIQRRPPPPEVLLGPKEEEARDYKGDVVAFYPEEFPEDTKDLYMGLAHIANSADLEKGIAYLDTAMKREGGRTFSAVYTRGVALKMLGRMDEARRGLEEAVKMRPDHPQAWMALGDLHEQQKNYKDSINCYTRASELDPRLSRAQNGLGTSLMLSGNLEDAEKAFRKAATLEPFDDNPRLNLSGLYLNRGDFGAAAAEARMALAINPNRSAGWGHLAQCALAENKPAEAVWPIVEAIKLDGNEMHNGELLLEACKGVSPSQALSLLDQLTTRAPFVTLSAQAMVALRNGDKGKAVTVLQEAARHDELLAVMPIAAQAALECRRPELALGWSSEFVTKRPEDDQGQVLYASALRAMGQEGEAAKVLEDALVGGRSPRVLNALAWLRSTARDGGLRDGRAASDLLAEATKTMGSPNVFMLQTQAAVAAENGRLEEAEAIAQEALTMARSARLHLEAEKIEEQLGAYGAGRPYRSEW